MIVLASSSRVVSLACSLTVRLRTRTPFERQSNSMNLKSHPSHSLVGCLTIDRLQAGAKMISSQHADHDLTEPRGSGGGAIEKRKPLEADNINSDSMNQTVDFRKVNGFKTTSSQISEQYSRAIRDLNFLQSNTQVLALAKYKTPETIIPLFKRQLELAGLQVSDLNRLNAIHVSGTKGKGSTCAFAESILRQAGLKTGFYNSPHLVKVTERIKINGQPISEDLFARYFRQVYDRLVDGTRREKMSMPSYFSFLTILAFHIFLEEGVDCSLIEVGIGGEYDPTNVVEQPVACVITTLDLDHTNILGKTIERIAWTKAGIMKEGSPLFTIRHEQSSAMDMILKRACSRNSPVQLCEPFAKLPNGTCLGIDSEAQFTNASLACHSAKYLLEKLYPKLLACDNQTNGLQASDTSATKSFDLTTAPRFFLDGLVNCRWPGRCQIINYRRVTFFIDGAHTKKSMENCLDWFVEKSLEIDPDALKVLLINVIGERDRSEILKPLTRYNGFKSAIFSTNRINTAGDTPKSETFVNMQGPNCEKSIENIKLNSSIWLDLVEKAGDNRRTCVLTKANIMDSLTEIDDMLRGCENQKCHVLATGSLHFVGAILETLQSIDKKAFGFV